MYIVCISLVNTPFCGTDPNWCRLIVAIGYSSVDIDPDVIDLSLGDINLLKNSEPVNYSEELATKYLENDNIYININLNQGNYSGKVCGCDLTYEYVRINASYRSYRRLRWTILLY